MLQGKYSFHDRIECKVKIEVNEGLLGQIRKYKRSELRVYFRLGVFQDRQQTRRQFAPTRAGKHNAK